MSNLTAANGANAGRAAPRQAAFVVLADGTKLTLNDQPKRLANGDWELATVSGGTTVHDADLWLSETQLALPTGLVSAERPIQTSVVLPDGGRIEGKLLAGDVAKDTTRLSWQRRGGGHSLRLCNAALAGLEIHLRPPGVPALHRFAARRNPLEVHEQDYHAALGDAACGFAIVGDGQPLLPDVMPKLLPDDNWHLSVAGQSRMVPQADIWIVETDVVPEGELASRASPLPTIVVLPDGQRLQGELLGTRLGTEGTWLRWRRNGRELTLHLAAHAVTSIEYTMQPPRRGSQPELACPKNRVPQLRNNADLDAYLAATLQSPQVVEPGLLADLPIWLENHGGSAAARDIFTLAQRLGLALIDPHEVTCAPPAVAAVPPQLVRRTRMVPLRIRQGVLAVATDQPQNREAHSSIEFATGLRVLPLLALPPAIDALLGRQFNQVEDATLLKSLDLGPDYAEDSEQTAHENERLALQKPVVGLVTGLIEDAVRRRASDIHVRPRAEDFEVLFRIDGALVAVRNFAKPLLRAVVSRIKVIAGMDLAEHRLPQDGRVSVSYAGTQIDLRISVLPSVYGESVVLRLLNSSGALRNIAEIGFSAHDEDVFRDILAHSNGMLLVTGPTGCGKSTTLYAALMEVRKQNLNIITVENPVEYHIPDVTQIQVRPEIELDFARILRNILRHDPNVIMIGEIRDHETAGIAVECALTGHLVLSTLHTNNAATTITRLLDLGVESYLLSSTLLGVLAQRLARRNCPHCLEPEQVPPFVRAALGVGADETFYHGIGCSQCNGSGVHGRMAVYELLPVTPEIRRLIVPNADGDAIHASALATGMVPITTHAVELARTGTISLAEAYRIRVE